MPTKQFQPAYAVTEKEGRMKEKIEEAYSKYEECDLCPRNCRVNRLKGEKGFCSTLDQAKVHSYSSHFGEEKPLVGNNGSGTIFFSSCNLRCVFCQNWAIAFEEDGRRVNDEELAEMMLDLQRRGCHNINLVTPTYTIPNILNAVRTALKRGLRLPLCYNSGGYESLETIKLLDGIIDIYLSDLKFMDKDSADKYITGKASDYPEKAKRAITAMHKQVGDLLTDNKGTAVHGLMVRHLVMPNNASGTREFINWFANNLSRDTYLNIMSQYRPEHRACEYENISRAITPEEFKETIEWALEAGLTNLDKRSLAQYEIYRNAL